MSSYSELHLWSDTEAVCWFQDGDIPQVGPGYKAMHSVLNLDCHAPRRHRLYHALMGGDKQLLHQLQYRLMWSTNYSLSHCWRLPRLKVYKSPIFFVFHCFLTKILIQSKLNELFHGWQILSGLDYEFYNTYIPWYRKIKSLCSPYICCLGIKTPTNCLPLFFFLSLFNFKAARVLWSCDCQLVHPINGLC